MDHFAYSDGELFCEGVPLRTIAQRAGTPAYVYSHATLQRHYRVFDEAFAGIPHIICYSCKANSSLAVLRTLQGLGAGADIVSGGELFIALKAGIPSRKIVFSGVGKTAEELRHAVRSDILMINIESADELGALAAISRRLKRKVPVSIRVNPEIDPKTHPYITTGLKKNKFGVLASEALVLYERLREEPFLEPVGISSHIGSQILELDPFAEAVRFLTGMAARLKKTGIPLRYLDIGGGLGITYRDESPPPPKDYGKVVRRELRGHDLTLVMEPGRVIVGNSGIFLTRLLYIKKSGEKTFYVVDGAMNDLVRPSLYNAYHEILPVRGGVSGRIMSDIVGPVCESGDFLAKDRPMPELEKGDLLAVKGAGAYGFSMSSNYNSRRRVPEVLVKGTDFAIVRRRESFRDFVRHQSIPSFLEAEAE